MTAQDPAGHAIIIGGGISGLSAAADLARARVPHTLIEKRPRLGGLIETRYEHDCVLEGGPDSFISQKPEALELIRELGLESEVIGSNDSTRITYILRHGRLVRLPEGMMMIVPSRVWPMLKSPLLGWGAKLRMARELLRRPAPHADRSVADFVIDHFGEEALDYLAEPLLYGVYGGDPHQMSVASVLPRFAEMEAKQGSLARAALTTPTAPRSGSLFRTLKGGLGTLTAKLSEGVNVRRGEARAAEYSERRFRVQVDSDWLAASHLVLACPAWAAAALLGQGFDPELAARLREIPYSSSALVSLGYREAEFDGMRAGHGFLIPKKERRRMAACTFVDTKFAGRAPAGTVLLRCFFGGAADEAALEESDESLVSLAREELRRIIGLSAAPVFTTVSRWPRSMAQYTVGHAARWREIQSRAAAVPGLYLAGNGYTGIGIPDCIRMGRAAAKEIVRALGSSG